MGLFIYTVRSRHSLRHWSIEQPRRIRLEPRSRQHHGLDQPKEPVMTQPTIVYSPLLTVCLQRAVRWTCWKNALVNTPG